MKRASLLFCVLAALVLWPVCAGVAIAAPVEPELNGKVSKAIADLSLPFIENKGQVRNPAVAYVAETFACQIEITRKGEMIYRLPAGKSGTPQKNIEIREQQVGATAAVRGLDKQPANVSYYQGRDPSGWQRNLPCYKRLEIGRMSEGIRMELKAHGRNVEKLFCILPGADPGAIRMAVQGVDNLQINPKGELLLSTPSATLQFSKPMAYQQKDGVRHMVPVRYQVSEKSYGFELGPYDKSRELIIDPELVKVSSFEKEDSVDALMALAADGQGNIYAAGYYNHKLAVYKLDNKIETVLASTFFSHGARYKGDLIRCIALDSQGNVFVAGKTDNKADFPVVQGGYDTRMESLCDKGFVVKFSADLARMLATTFVGGDFGDELFAIAINSQDQIYVAGYSEPGEVDKKLFPVVEGAYDMRPAPFYQKKAVVLRFDNSLSKLEAATYLGGQLDDEDDKMSDVALGLLIDGQDNIWVSGWTNQPDFPVTEGCLQATSGGQEDIFLSKFDPDLKHLLISTYIGGGQNEGPRDMLLDDKGNLYLLGWTYSGNFPMAPGGYDSSYGNLDSDGFILKLNEKADKILAGTFLGGTADGSGINQVGNDMPAAMSLSADNSRLYVVGWSESVDFPVTPDCIESDIDTPGLEKNRKERYPRVFCTHYCRQEQNGNKDAAFTDGFVSVLSSDLSRMIFTTFIGSESCDYFDDLLINGDDIIVAGQTQSSAFPMSPVDHIVIGRGVLLRLTDNETTDNSDGSNDKPGSDDPPAAASGGGGGGGGGCFLSILQW